MSPTATGSASGTIACYTVIFQDLKFNDFDRLSTPAGFPTVEAANFYAHGLAKDMAESKYGSRDNVIVQAADLDMCQSFLVLSEKSYASSVMARIVVSKVDLQGVKEVVAAEEEDDGNSTDEEDEEAQNSRSFADRIFRVPRS
ncbi:hypothetical protein P154DRAFT_601865 [Amniculicola lignicola CBS 123094]|uniref:Uncharacterized protein n=1 Tax=Amniculicola lignicola CBS 123094 TaxID=1392246 RepID=A0A6A5WIX6_9PLEO|nr:hypothetical protein P154DRAFT_601865 [Amniculicola lignicola CBS 123094]